MKTESHAPAKMNGHKPDGQASIYPTMDTVRSSISREFHHFLADVEDLIKDTTSLTGDDLHRAKEKLNKRIAAAKESVEEMGDEIAQRAQKTAVATNRYVHQKPWQVVGIGAAVGFVFGLLLMRRG